MRVLSDGSLVFRRDDATVHVDALGRALHVRTGTAHDALGGILLASYTFDAVREIRVVRGAARWWVEAIVKTGEAIDLGAWSRRTEAEQIANAVADLTQVVVDRPQSPPPILQGWRGDPLGIDPEDSTEPPLFDTTSDAPPRADTSPAAFEMPETRYFSVAPGRLATVTAWSGIRTANGAFVRALSMRVPIQADARWPDLVAAPRARYFSAVPGRLWTPAAERSSRQGSSVARADNGGRSVSTLDDRVAELQAVVGRWKEPTPPPRFPPSSRRLEEVDAQLILPDIRRPNHPSCPAYEAPWAVSVYEAHVARATLSQPDFLRARTIGTDEPEPDDVRPPPVARGPARRAAPPPGPPPAILQIPGFNDAPPEDSARPPSRFPPARRRPAPRPAPVAEPVFQRLLNESQVGRADDAAKIAAVEGDDEVLSSIRRSAERLPVASLELALTLRVD